jgi:hypothetical protein
MIFKWKIIALAVGVAFLHQVNAQEPEWLLLGENVGVGTGSPQSKLHVEGRSGTKVMVENTDSRATGDQVMYELRNASTSKARFFITTGGNTWSFNAAYVGDFFEISRVGTGLAEFMVNANGDMTVRGNSYASSHVNVSSKDLKTDFSDVDADDVLHSLVELPVLSWRYKKDTRGERHVGPVAEDFERLFKLGDGKTISTVDVGGIALAAIKALKIEKDEEIDALKRENAQLRKSLAELETLDRERIKRLEHAFAQFKLESSRNSSGMHQSE